MITFTKKADPRPVADEARENRFEQIRKAAAEGRGKPDVDNARRRTRQAAEDGRLP